MPAKKKKEEQPAQDKDPVNYIDEGMRFELQRVAHLFRDHGYPEERTGLKGFHAREDREYIELSQNQLEKLEQGKRLSFFSVSESGGEIPLGTISRFSHKDQLHFFPAEKTKHKISELASWSIDKPGQAIVVTPKEHIKLGKTATETEHIMNESGIGHMLIHHTQNKNNGRVLRVFNFDKRPLVIVHEEIRLNRKNRHVI